MGEEGSGRGLAVRRHIPEHADDDRGKGGQKNKPTEKEEEEFEADPSPGETAVLPPDWGDDGLTGGDDFQEDELQAGAHVEHDEADGQ